jgi:transcriptional regulator with XRE-family HTH domain
MLDSKKILKDLVDRSGLSQKKYAEKHDLCPNKLNGWLTGVRNIYLPTLQLLAFEDGLEIITNYEIVELVKN